MAYNRNTQAFIEQKRKNDSHIQVPEYDGLEFAKTFGTPTHDVEISKLSKERVRDFMDEAVLLDVRSKDSFRQSDRMIKGAVHVNPDDLHWLMDQRKDAPYVLYDDTPGQEKALWVAKHMINMNFRYAAVLDGGWEDWLAADFPTAPRQQ